MIGWPRAPRAAELPYIAPEYRDLPEVGWLTGRGDTINLEVLLQSEPDLILDFGSVRDTYVSLADRVQAQTGIPYRATASCCRPTIPITRSPAPAPWHCCTVAGWSRAERLRTC